MQSSALLGAQPPWVAFLGRVCSSSVCAVWGCVSAWSCQARLQSSSIPLGRKGCLKACFAGRPPPCHALQMSQHIRRDPSLWAPEFRKLLASSAHSHMGWSQNRLFFAWRLLSSHRRPSLAFFHRERETGTAPMFLLPTTEALARKSSWHLSSCLEKTPVPNLTVPRAASGTLGAPQARLGCFHPVTLKTHTWT